MTDGRLRCQGRGAIHTVRVGRIGRTPMGDRKRGHGGHLHPQLRSDAGAAAHAGSCFRLRCLQQRVPSARPEPPIYNLHSHCGAPKRLLRCTPWPLSPSHLIPFFIIQPSSASRPSPSRLSINHAAPRPRGPRRRSSCRQRRVVFRTQQGCYGCYNSRKRCVFPHSQSGVGT